MDRTQYTMRHGVVVAPADRMAETWAEHDALVGMLLFAPLEATEERYRRCFPAHDLGPSKQAKEWCDFFLSDGHSSCGLCCRGGDAYLNRFCAWPQGKRHGGAFMDKLKLCLSDFERLWLFADRGCDNRVVSFYGDRCGFALVEDPAVPPPWIEEMWGNDLLFVYSL